MKRYRPIIKEEIPTWQCQECMKKFKKNVSKGTTEIKCPKCKSTDIDLISDTEAFY